MKKTRLLYLTSSLLIGNLFASEAEVLDRGAIISNRMRASLQDKSAKPLNKEEISKSNPAEYFVRCAIEMILESLRQQEMIKNNQKVDTQTALNAGQEMFALGIDAFAPSIHKGVLKEVPFVGHNENEEGHFEEEHFYNDSEKEYHFKNQELKEEPFVKYPGKEEAHFENDELKQNPFVYVHESKDATDPTKKEEQQQPELISEEEKQPESDKSTKIIVLDQESKENYEKIKKASLEELKKNKNEIYSDSASKLLIEFFENHDKDEKDFKDTEKVLFLLPLCDTTSLKFEDIPQDFIKSNASGIEQNITQVAKTGNEFATKLYVKAISFTKEGYSEYFGHEHLRKVKGIQEKLTTKQKADLFEIYFPEGVKNARNYIAFEVFARALLPNDYECSEGLFEKINVAVQSGCDMDKISKLQQYFTEEQRLYLGSGLIKNSFEKSKDLIKQLLDNKITQEQKNELLNNFNKMVPKKDFINSINVIK